MSLKSPLWLAIGNIKKNKRQTWYTNSVTRLGDLLDFGQIFKAFGNNLFVQISHILRKFL